jgi:predicted PurR-regulated permease PerM
MLPPPTETQSRILWFAFTSVAVAAILALLGGVVWSLGVLLRLLSPVLWPLAVAGVLAYLLDPLVDLLGRRGIPRARAILLVFVTALALMVGALASVVPQIYRETQQFAERVPGYSQKVQQQVNSWATNPPVLVRKALDLRSRFLPGALKDTNAAAANGLDAAPRDSSPHNSEGGPAIDPGTLKSATTWLANLLPEAGAWAFGQVSKVSGWFGILAGLALIPVYAFYFLLEKDGIERRWTDYLPVRHSEFKDELVFVLRSINDYLIVYFRSQVLVALCDGVLYTIGFLIIGLPYAFLIGLVATVMTMIPFLGAIVTCGAAVVIGFATSGSWQLPAGAVVVFAVVQVIEGLVISPKIMGERVGLHPLTIIIAVMVGTNVMGGVLGGVLAIPLTAALRVLMFRYVWRVPANAGKGDAKAGAKPAKGSAKPAAGR